MTISTTTNRYSYAGNGTTDAFSYASKFLANADLVVLLVDADGVPTTQVLNTDYTVTGAGAANGGTVTMTTPPASDETLVIYGDPDITQSLDLVNNDSFDADDLEETLDRSALINQRQNDRIERSLRLADSDTSSATTELSTVGHFGEFLRLSNDGTAFEFAAGDVTTGTFLQDGTGAQSRTVVSKLSEIVSVKDFGAVGNGSADDTDEIQAAVSAVADAGGGTVFFPPGIYRVSTTIEIVKDYVQLLGAVKGQPFSFGGTTQGGTLVRAASGFSGDHIFQFAQNSPTRSLVNCGIRDIGIGGFNATSANGIYWMVVNGDIDNVFLSGMGCGIFMDGVGYGGILSPYDSFINNVKVQNVAGNGIEMNGHASDMRFTNVIVTAAGGHGIYCNDDGTGLVEVAGPGTQFLGCYIYSCAGKAIYCRNPWQMEFVGNRLQDCNGGIYFDVIASTFGGMGFKIVGNVFRNLSNAADNTTDGININVNGVGRGGLITGNSFYTDLGLGNTSYNRMRYGINIAHSNAQDIVIGPNSQGYVTAATSCFGTGYLSDSGTRTIVCGGLDANLRMFNKYGNGVMDLTGSGSPEGAVTAPVGSFYRRSDGGASTSLYVKESGTGNTGWVAK